MTLFTAVQALEMALEIEKNGQKFYTEVAGKSAFLVDPDNIEQAADTVFNVLANKQLRQGMIDDGLEYVRKFSWKKAAKETLETYRKACR